MNITISRLRGAAGAGFAAMLLAGCGGGGDGGSSSAPVTQAVPGSASASTDGFIGYLKALVASNADTLEPVDVSAVAPPSDDAGGPQVVD